MIEQDGDQPEIVHVSSSAKAAFAAPSFIIEQDGRYYVTAAVLEYDPRAPNLTREQQEGVKQIQELYRSGEKTASGVTQISREIGPMPMNTGPHR